MSISRLNQLIKRDPPLLDLGRQFMICYQIRPHQIDMIGQQQIINILEDYVKPTVAGDGGNILFDSYNEDEKRVKVVLQGACNGCPSSTFTLKSGIENMLKDMLNDKDIIVEALNG